MLAQVITAVAALLAALLSFANRKKIQEVHVLVNSKFSDALQEIVGLKQQLTDAGVEPRKVNGDPADG